MIQMGKLSAVINTAISGYASSSSEFILNRKLYPTLSRVGVTAEQISSGIQAFLQYNNWTRFAIVSDAYVLSVQVCDAMRLNGLLRFIYSKKN
jgi:hypothetical protein